MKNSKLILSFFAAFALIFSSCSKDETALTNSGETTSLSFATVLNDVVNNKGAMKQSLEDLPSCSEAAPAFVGVVLSGPEDVGSMDDPLIVKVNPTPGDYDGEGEAYFTEESTDLELPEGTYQLQYFVVYDGDPDDASTNVLWVAPMAGSDLASFVQNPLPQEIILKNGVKKYVDVEVLCFDNRMVNEYGYLFFDIRNTNAIEFCLFGNYCDENGRHFPAAFSVDVWSYVDGEKGALIHSGLENTVAMDENGDYAGSPLCMPLPDTEGLDEYYMEITILGTDEYDMEPTIIRSGVFTDEDVKDLFDGDDNTDYYHFREGNCNLEDVPLLLLSDDDSGEPGNGGEEPGNGDGGDEDCTIGSADEGCLVVYLSGETGWVTMESAGDGFSEPYFLTVEDSTEVPFGSVTAQIQNGKVVVLINNAVLDDYVLEISQNSDGVNSICVAVEDVDAPSSGDEPDAIIEFDAVSDFTYPFYVKLKANVCPVD